MLRRLLSLLLCLHLGLPAVFADKARSLVPENVLSLARLMGGDADDARLERVRVTHPDFKEALRVHIPRRSKVDFNVQLRARLTDGVSAQEVLLLEFWARMIESRDETGEGRASLVLEQSSAPYTKVIPIYPWSVGPEWKKFVLPVRALKALPAGEAVLHFRLGGAAQTLEFAGLRVQAFGPDHDLASLPPSTLHITYAGRDANAPWRAEAEARIEKHRKAELAVRVVDADGRPLPNAEVHARLVRHDFRFSTAVDARALLASEDEFSGSDRYREMIPQVANMVTLENDLKWPQWERNSPRALAALDWLREHQLPVRGHVLFWPSWQRSPEDLRALASDPDALRKRILDHAETILTATRGLVGDWDVVNEPQTHFDILRVLGDDIMVEVFKLARRHHTGGHLFLNEALHFSQDAKLDEFERMALDLRRRGAPIDGLGFQCHYGGYLTPPARIIQVLDRFAAHGFVLQVTEFDVDLTDEQVQADYLRDFTTAVFSHPAVDTLQLWGFWERRHWRPNAALWRKDWSIKPAGQAWLDLLHRQWSTDETLRTDAEGRAATRGFLGDYEIAVRHGDRGTTTSLKLTVGSAPTTITLR